MIEKKPFVSYTLDDDKKKGAITISIKLNPEEQEQLLKDKQILQQTKDSTAIKQLMALGSKVIHDKKIKELIEIVISNKRKNKRLGIVDFD
jgi:urease gamma subunit